MIITCEECSTRFQLDDARVPDEGIRVRCSRCKHAFFVKADAPPTGGDRVEDAIERALAEEAGSPADSGQQLMPSTARARPEGGGGPDDLEESDWQFNTEPERGGQASSFQEPPGLTMDDAGSTGSNLELADGSLGSDGMTADEAVRQAAEQPVSDAASEAVDDLLAGVGAASDDVDDLFDTDPMVDHGIDALLDGETQPTAPDDEPGVTDPILDPVDTELSAEPGPPATDPDPLGVTGGPSALAQDGEGGGRAGAGEELGEPDDWDFFAGEAGTAPAPGDGQALVIGQIGVSAGTGGVHPPVDVEAEEPSAVGIWVRRASHGAAWAVVAALAALILPHALRPATPAPPAVAQQQEVGPLVASEITGRWVENAAGGSLYVISGELRSVAGSRQPGVVLAVRLFDAGGNLLSEEAALVGPAINPTRLRDVAPDELRAQQARGAVMLATSSFSEVEGFPFDAVLEDLPEAAERFDLVATPLAPPPPAAEPPAGAPPA